MSHRLVVLCQGTRRKGWSSCLDVGVRNLTVWCKGNRYKVGGFGVIRLIVIYEGAYGEADKLVRKPLNIRLVLLCQYVNAFVRACVRV